MKRAFKFGVRNVVIEGDCLPLINMLKSCHIHDTSVGFFVQDILRFAKNFDLLPGPLLREGVIGQLMTSLINNLST